MFFLQIVIFHVPVFILCRYIYISRYGQQIILLLKQLFISQRLVHNAVGAIYSMYMVSQIKYEIHLRRVVAN